MSYEPISFFSPLECPSVVSQVARTMQPEAKFVITATNPSSPDIPTKHFDGLMYFVLIGGLIFFVYIAVKAIDEYVEQKKQKK